MIKFHRYSGDSIEKQKMLELEIECKSGRGNKAHFESLFENNPVARSIIIVAVDNDGKIIGKSHTIPTLIGYKGSTHLAHLSCGILVHPSARGQGVFKKITELVNKEILADGGKVRCGFPNSNSAHALKKYFNYKRKDEIIVMVKLLRDFSTPLRFLVSYFFSFFNIFLNFKKDARYKVKKQNLYTNELSECLKVNLANKKEIYFFKDINYLNWRYGCNKEFQYDLYTLDFNNKPCGYIVIRNVKNNIKIIDFQICKRDKTTFVEMLKLIEKQYPKARSFWLLSGSNRWYHKFLMCRFFIPVNKKKTIEFNLKSFNDTEWPENLWDIHFGDSDTA